MKQAEDFREEANVLAEVLAPLKDADYHTETLFKNWTINDVIGHLHMFDVAALKTLESAESFDAFFAPIAEGLQQGKTLLETQYPWLVGLEGEALFKTWCRTSGELADAYAKADPKQRVKWAGPEMSALSSIAARQMETWAHGQEIFDVLGKERVEGDRIRNICHLGVNTFGWTFMNRTMVVPDPAPYVRLAGPSGTVWEWNEPQDGNAVSGDAVEFAQVVTQVRSVDDISIQTVGEAAKTWMALAQCFAGSPEDPPKKGERHRAEA